jgi:hypothetical protein
MVGSLDRAALEQLENPNLEVVQKLHDHHPAGRTPLAKLQATRPKVPILCAQALSQGVE